MQTIDEESIRQMLREQDLISAYSYVHRGFGNNCLDPRYVAQMLEVPASLCFALEALFDEQKRPEPDALDSISLFSLLKGVFLPLSGMNEHKVAQLFGFRWQDSRKTDNKDLVLAFLRKPIGLTLGDKICYLLGDPFAGKPSRMGQDSLLRILSCIRFVSVEKLREKLPHIGDIGILFSENANKIRSHPPIGAKEALYILQRLPQVASNRKKAILSDLLLRAGGLERYFLARLILRRLNFGYEYRSELIVQALGEHYQISAQAIENAITLSDIFQVADILQHRGIKGLQQLVLKPLNPVTPALAGNGEVKSDTCFPLWVECKYDGIRIMIHKETGAGNQTKYAAFTRRRYDWLEFITGLESTLPWIAAYSYIIDGELHGKILDGAGLGFRQATVYEIYRYLQGSSTEIVRLQYIAFDLLYVNGQEITNLPFIQRRQMLEQLIVPLGSSQLSLPVLLSEGWEAKTFNEFKKWYRYFRNQGHEGVIAKMRDAPYTLGKRTHNWLKKKEALYLDLVISGALWATGNRGPQTFSTYVLSCRDEHCWREVGRAEGLARESNHEIIQRIAMESLMTGNIIEIRTASAIRRGVELLPSIVVTIRFEDIVRNSKGVFSLRDPKIVCIRPRGDISPEEVDQYHTLEQFYLEKRLK